MPEPTRPQPVTDPDYPDLVHIEGGWSFPCKVVEITATMAPTNRVEGVGDLNATYEQTQQYVIRVRPKPVQATYMTGVSDEDIERAKESVIESALEVLDGQQGAPDHVSVVPEGQDFRPEHRFVLRAYRHAHGEPTVQARPPRAVEVNQAVTWWNEQQRGQHG